MATPETVMVEVQAACRIDQASPQISRDSAGGVGLIFFTVNPWKIMKSTPSIPPYTLQKLDHSVENPL
jgi:hypothetical protein